MRLVAAMALLLSLPERSGARQLIPPERPASSALAAEAGAFSGTYRLTLSFGASCERPSRVPPGRRPDGAADERTGRGHRCDWDSASLTAQLREASIAQGSEVESEPVFGIGEPDAGNPLWRPPLLLTALLRQGGSLRGPLAVQGSEAVIRTDEGPLLWARLVLTGEATASASGRPLLRAAAFGELWLVCDDGQERWCRARDHRVTLDPL